MKKYFILILLVMGLVSFDASAFIEQSSGSALSLNNTVNNFTYSAAAPSPAQAPNYVEEPVEQKTVAAAKTLDIRNSVAKNVSLEHTQELIVVLPEKMGQSWKVNYDSNKISMIDSSTDGENRRVKFSQTSSKDNTLYFDCLDEKGQVVQNKAVYIKVN